MHCRLDIGLCRFGYITDDIIVVAGIEDRACLSACMRCCGFPFRRRTCLKDVVQRGKCRFIRKIEAGGICPFGAEETSGCSNAVVPCAGNGVSLDHGDRIFQQGSHRHGGIRYAVDEGGVRAVFQQTADKICKQRLVGANRRIKAAGTIELLLADDFAVKRFAHAVQALELIITEFEVRTGEMVDGRHGLGVVGRKLREHDVTRGKQLAGAGDIGDIRVHFAGEDREVFQPVHLCALDLRIPIGALDKTHHDAATGTSGEIDDVVENKGAAAAIGLHNEA